MDSGRFTIGQPVLLWDDRSWHTIKRVAMDTGRSYIYELENGEICAEHILSANPFADIPPKPRPLVTKEANYCRDHWRGAFGKPFDCAEDEIRATGYATFIFPADATNIKVTYQVKE